MRRRLILLLLLTPLGGCMTWTPAPADLRDTLDRSALKSVRVTTTDGARMVVEAPRIMNDSLIAVEQVCRISVAAGGRRICQEDWERVAAVNDVALVELRKTNPWGTAALFVVIPVAVASLLVLASCSGSGSSGGIGSPC